MPVDMVAFGPVDLTLDGEPVLGGFKFADRSGVAPVYRRSRFDWRVGLLSGPAWAGALAVVSARRVTLRAWLSEGAARFAMVGVLAAGVGVPASMGTMVAASRPTAVAHAPVDADTDPSGSSAAQTTGGGGPAADILQPSEIHGDHQAKRGNVLEVTEPPPLGMGGEQGRNTSFRGMGGAQALAERINLLGDIGVYELSGAGGSNLGSGGPRNGGSGLDSNSDSNSDSSESGSASDGSALSSFASGSQGSPSDDTLPGAGGVSGWQAGLSATVSAGHVESGSIGASGGSGSDIAARPSRLFEDLRGAAHGFHGEGLGGGGSVDLGDSDPIGGLSPGLDAPGPGGASKAFFIAGPVSGGSGLPGGVPEPSTWVIMVLGLALIGGSARQRRAVA